MFHIKSQTQEEIEHNLHYRSYQHSQEHNINVQTRTNQRTHHNEYIYTNRREYVSNKPRGSSTNSRYTQYIARDRLCNMT